MAHFCSYPGMEKITEITIPNSLDDPGSEKVTIGLWDFRDPGGNEFEVQHPLIDVKKGDEVGMVRLYELSSFHTGRWILEASTQAGMTSDVLIVNVAGTMHTFGGAAASKSFYAGFDRLVYPGDAVMQKVMDKTNISWCGFYLAPAPSQSNASWMGKRKFPQGMGWGFAPIYVGQQSDGPGSHTVTAAQGTLDAQDAAQLALSAGFPSGSIIFLDIEQGPPAKATTLAYYKAWTAELEDKTAYKSGVYCSYSHVAQSLYDADKRPVFWVYNLNQYSCDPAAPAARRISNTSPFPSPDPALSGVTFANLWQLAQGSQCGISAGGSSLTGVDFDSSAASDPSDPNTY
jgi:hypothetical protein